MTDPAPYLTADEIRAEVTGLSGVNTPDQDPPDYKYPDATLERFVTRFEALAENYRGVAFTPRTVTLTTTISNCGAATIVLPHQQVTAVTAISYSYGTAPDPATLVITDGYRLSLPGGAWWSDGLRVTLTYTHGHATVPPAVIDACIEFVRAEVIQQAGSQPRNVTGERTDLGWIPEPTADIGKGRPTRWTAVNEALNQVPDERIPGIA